MSTFRERSVACSGCGVEERRWVATSINATRTPHWRDAILDGSFQVFTCDRCDTRTAPLLPFPYVDFGRRLLIGVFPAADEATWWEHEDRTTGAFLRNLGADAPAVAQPLGDGMVVRTVFGLAALREKVVVFAAGLDDGVLETLKLRLLLLVDELVPGLDGRPRLASADGDELVFDVAHPAAGEAGRLRVDRQEYDHVLADPDVRPIIEAVRGGPYQDAGRVLLAAPTGSR